MSNAKINPSPKTAMELAFNRAVQRMANRKPAPPPTPNRKEPQNGNS